MKQYDTFFFDSYSFDAEEGKIELAYSLDDEVSFIETIHVPVNPGLMEVSSDLEEALFALHLIGGMSYYKTCLPKKIEIRSGKLTPKQADFWNEVYENGLGEFFYRNAVDFRGLIRFPGNAEATPAQAEKVDDGGFATKKSMSMLVPIGGGKDSLVTAELLRDMGFRPTLLRVGEHALINEQARLTRFPIVNIKRQLSTMLFKLNEDGALNGHVPITAYISILSIVVAIIRGDSHVIFSNEESANVGNTEFHGKEINHQWSKSLAFEKMLREYVSANVTQNVEYFSLLRPLSELKITELFCTLPQYLPLVTSCNVNWKLVKGPRKDSSAAFWCGQCPKCAFVFALFAAFLPRADVVKIFGKDLFEDEALLPLYRELLGLENFKPFECVGTPEETAAAFLLAKTRGEFDGSKAMEMFVNDCLPEITEPDEMIGKAMMIRPDHCVPVEFAEFLKHL